MTSRASNPGTGLPEELKLLARAEEAELLAGARGELEALAEGTLPPERVAALEAAARRDPELAATLELYRPVGPAFTDALVARLAAAALPADAPARASAGGANDDLARRRESGRRGRRRALVSLGGLAAAAGVAVIVGRSRPAALPEFEVELTGGIAELRGGDSSAVAAGGRRLHPDGEIDLVLRPKEAVVGPLAATAFVRGDRPGEAGLRPLGLPLAVSPAGAVRVSGPVAAIFAGGGDRVRLVVVLQSRADPAEAARIAAGRVRAGRGARAIEVALSLARTAR